MHLYDIYLFIDKKVCICDRCIYLIHTSLASECKHQEKCSRVKGSIEHVNIHLILGQQYIFGRICEIQNELLLTILYSLVAVLFYMLVFDCSIC